MASAHRLVAFAWHQRTSPIDTRERLLGALTGGEDRVLLSTCHRVELYAALAEGDDPCRWLRSLGVRANDADAATLREGASALAHLFAVASGLDSAVVGEPQILAQVRRAAVAARHPLLVAALARALFVGRAVRAETGVSSTRSVGSLAVDALLGELVDPTAATVLVIGAGEMGKLALRALVRRVGSVVVANRDLARATALAETHGARAIGLDEVERYVSRAAAVLSAADTRGAVLTAPVVARRLRRGAISVLDIAVPRSVDADARALLGTAYRSVDDLPGARAGVPDRVLAAARARCEREASRFLDARHPERAAAIRQLRGRAEVVRAAKLERAMRRLGHLSERDRGVVAALSRNITNALLHEPTVALRERSLH